jgi:hypothetical protein
VQWQRQPWRHESTLARDKWHTPATLHTCTLAMVMAMVIAMSMMIIAAVVMDQHLVGSTRTLRDCAVDRAASQGQRPCLLGLTND